MRFQSELCHIDDKRAIVRVSAWDGQVNLGSALGEGETTTIAEDTAIKRLSERISTQTSITNPREIHNKEPEKSLSINDDHVPVGTIPDKKKETEKSNVEMSSGIYKSQHYNNINEPDDWSKELIEIENNLKRLTWDRVKENEYLKANFGIVDRNRITNYPNLLSYLNALKSLDESAQIENGKVITKESLLNRSNKLLEKLNWDTTKARDFLHKNFKVSTRRSLGVEQLQEFILLLEKQLET